MNQRELIRNCYCIKKDRQIKNTGSKKCDSPCFYEIEPKTYDLNGHKLVFRSAEKEDAAMLLPYLKRVCGESRFLLREPDECKELTILSSLENDKASAMPQRNVSVVQDVDGKNIVIINDFIFKGKRSVNWREVRGYLKRYVDEFFEIASTGDVIYIGSDLPNEYSGSKYTHALMGTNAKAKANATQGIPELLEIATGVHFRQNDEEKHWRNAKFGWYRYDSRFALPIYSDDGEIERYNVFHASLIVRHAEDEKMYLYDIIDIKKETSNSIEP